MKFGIKRREFLKVLPASGLAIVHSCSSDPASPSGSTIQPLTKAKVALVKTTDRNQGVKSLMQLMEVPDLNDKKVILKPNFNTDDPAPASTHNDTLIQIVTELQDRGATDLTLAERSFQPFDEVITNKGIDTIAQDMGFEIVNLNFAQKTRYTHPALSWKNGFDFPDIINESDYMVCTGCIKTHGSGGGFTMSLKLSVGLLPTEHMSELHSSPLIRSLISEINLAYQPDLIILDGVKVFITGGPSSGLEKYPGVMIAGTDRIAVDSVGLAILKEQSSPQITGKIFEQDQIARAVRLGLGIKYETQIEFIASDETSKNYADKLTKILMEG